jgi:hypothetical protein
MEATEVAAIGICGVLYIILHETSAEYKKEKYLRPKGEGVYKTSRNNIS